MSVVVSQCPGTLAIVVRCPLCPHQISGRAVTSQEWTDENGDVYFSASNTEPASALAYFIISHNVIV